MEDRLETELAPELEILRPLGQRRPPTVFLAREPALRRLVVVKVLDPDQATDKARIRFEREAQAAARIAHPNVVAVYRVGILDDGVPFFVMQHVEGRSLRDRLTAEGPLPETEVCRVLADVAAGLSAAHRTHVAHRDVRPSNVLLEEETGRVLLADFGSALPLITGETSGARLTTRDRVFGDSRYRSPEQLRGEDLTPLADVYGLGLLGYELITGEGPFEASTPTQWLAAHLHSDPRPISDLRDDVSPQLERLLLSCLSKVAEHRPRASDVVRQATGLIGTTPEAPRDHPPRAATLVAEPAQRGRPTKTLELLPGEETTPATPDNVIILKVLGSVDVRAADGRALNSISAQPKRVALLTHLAVSDHGGFKRRDRLLGVFWPEMEQERARHALRQAVYMLRQAMGAEVIESRGDDELRLAGDFLWCDATAFECAVAAGEHREALSWYGGPLLSSFHLDGAREFEHWLDIERHRLERLASDAAWSLSDQENAVDNAVGAAYWADKAVELAPWDEASWYRLIDLLDQVGDRAGALHAYGRLSRQLDDEFEAEPAPDTQALARRVREG